MCMCDDEYYELIDKYDDLRKENLKAYDLIELKNKQIMFLKTHIFYNNPEYLVLLEDIKQVEKELGEYNK